MTCSKLGIFTVHVNKLKYFLEQEWQFSTPLGHQPGSSQDCEPAAQKESQPCLQQE